MVWSNLVTKPPPYSNSPPKQQQHSGYRWGGSQGGILYITKARFPPSPSCPNKIFQGRVASFSKAFPVFKAWNWFSRIFPHEGFESFLKFWIFVNFCGCLEQCFIVKYPHFLTIAAKIQRRNFDLHFFKNRCHSLGHWCILTHPKIANFLSDLSVRGLKEKILIVVSKRFWHF